MPQSGGEAEWPDGHRHTNAASVGWVSLGQSGAKGPSCFRHTPPLSSARAARVPVLPPAPPAPAEPARLRLGTPKSKSLHAAHHHSERTSLSASCATLLCASSYKYNQQCPARPFRLPLVPPFLPAPDAGPPHGARLRAACKYHINDPFISAPNELGLPYHTLQPTLPPPIAAPISLQSHNLFALHPASANLPPSWSPALHDGERHHRLRFSGLLDGACR